MKVLHITSWFPNNSNSKEALWVKRHIDALEPFCENTIWHVRTIETSKKLFIKKYGNKRLKHFLIGLTTNRWVIIEIVTFCQLFFIGLFNKGTIRKSKIINFHIAYPNLTYWNLLRFIYNKPIVITEHWSAYHFNFGVIKPLPRIQNIFKQEIPLITVSNALGSDIKNFSNTLLNYCVIPNIVDTEVFYMNPSIYREKQRFFMLSQWNPPKTPLKTLKVFKEYFKNNPESQLIIGGYGILEQEIIDFIKQNNLTNRVSFIGKLNENQIQVEMNKATAFIHLSKYETFSVVCAEALCCGCPVIASKVGGITELVNESNGILIENSDELLSCLGSISDMSFNSSIISQNAHQRFSKKVVGQKYYDVLKGICTNEVN